MKINNDSIKQSVDLATDKLGVNADKKVADKTNASQPAAASTESVTLSNLSSQLQSLEAKVANTEVFDADKVNEIKSAIAGGQFKVDSDKVADGLISSVKDLLNSQQS